MWETAGRDASKPFSDSVEIRSKELCDAQARTCIETRSVRDGRATTAEQPRFQVYNGCHRGGSDRPQPSTPVGTAQ